MIDWLRALAPYHDYGWFLALLTWGAAAFVGRFNLHGRREWAWLPWVAWSMAVAALIELLTYAWPADLFVQWAGHLPEDFLLGLCAAGAAFGLVRVLRVRRALRAVAAVALFAVAGARIESSELGAVALALSATLMAAMLAATPGTSRSVRFALLATTVALWLSSAGPVADAGIQPRQSIAFGEWTVLWSFAQALTGMAVCFTAVSPWFADAESRREWRPFLFGCAAWLVGGLGLAALMSAAARNRFEVQAMDRARMAAAMLDTAPLARLLDSNFRLTGIEVRPRPNSNPMLIARAEVLTTPAGIQARQQLDRIELLGLGGHSVAIATLRDGWVARFSSARYIRGKLRPDVGLSRVTEEDLYDWTERRARFLSLLVEWKSRANQNAYAQAPIVTSDGRMLGWLLVEISRNEWVEAQAVPRLQTFVIVGLGLAIATLVTLQRVRTRERESARAVAIAATQADQLKTSFLAKVSHELRTPIQSVLGYSDLLRSVVTEPVARGRLKALRQHGELMLRLVNDLLDLSAIQAGAFRLVEKPTALVELVTQTIDSLRPRAEAKGLTVNLDIESSVPSWAELDGGRVRQVIINLVGNAIKFTDRGRVDVSLVRGPDDREVTLTVRDTGPGIAEADIGRLFRSFERLDATAAKEGTGLGLALSAALCRGMNGNISVESVEGEGATFIARFRAPPCEARLTTGSSAGLPPLSGRRILLADDNALVRELFVASLGDAGAICVAVADGVAALEAAQAQSFDAIVLDLAMPRLGGVEAAKKLRAEHGRDVRIIGLSAHAGQHERDDAIGAGMDAFLVKPVNLDELVAALAPASRTRPPVETGRMELLERLRAQFRAAAATEASALGAAIAARDYAAARARAHHLLNSATVVRDDWLYSACAAVERAAVTRDEAALTAAWQTCEAALEPWTRPAAGSADGKILSVS